MPSEEMPERIWLDADSYNGAVGFAHPEKHKRDGWPAYIRADLCASGQVRADDDAAHAEIERLGRELNLAKYGEPDFSWSIHKEAMSDLLARAEKAEAERDEAMAQVAAAFEAAAKTCSLAATNYLGKGADTDLGSRSRAICDVACRIRILTPAHAKAALEAYGREKVREGMRRAADICDCNDQVSGWVSRDAILAAMEKEAGE